MQGIRFRFIFDLYSLIELRNDRLFIYYPDLYWFSLAALTSEEERLWSAVKENAADFNSWTVLIQETEKLVSIGICGVYVCVVLCGFRVNFSGYSPLEATIVYFCIELFSLNLKIKVSKERCQIVVYVLSRKFDSYGTALHRKE